MLSPKLANSHWLIPAGAGIGVIIGLLLVHTAGPWFSVPKLEAVALLPDPTISEPSEARVVKAIPLTLEVATTEKPIPNPLPPRLKLEPATKVQLTQPAALRTTASKLPAAKKTHYKPIALWQKPPADTPDLPLSYFLTSKLWFQEQPAVYQAVSLGDNDLLREFLHLGRDANEPSLAGDTPLCAAVRHGDEKACDLLLLFGADANLPGRDGLSPVGLASLKRSPAILRLLLAHGAHADTPFPSPFPKEALEAILIKDLKHYLSVDSRITPLMACAARGDVEAAALLLKAGAKTGAYTRKYKRYPLNFAATQGYLFLMRVLLGRSADEEPDLLVTVDLSKQKAWITREGKVVDSTTISSGRKGYSTPTGRYVVTDKHQHHISTLYHVDMPWFMRLNCSAIGLHSGYVTGRPASHGCIRLPYNKAKAFFYQVKVGDEVEIVY
jgi:hypothetical protein